MKKWLLVLIITTLAIFLISCDKTKSDEEKQKALTENTNVVVAQSLSKQIPFSEEKDGWKVSGEILAEIVKLKETRGFAEFKMQDEIVLWVGLGRKNTGGYQVKVVSIEEVEGITNVFVEEVSPKEGAVVTQAITYPFVFVKFKAASDTFRIVNQKGEGFERLIANQMVTTKPTIEKNGIYVGQIDGNSIEIKIDGQAKAFRYSQKFVELIDSLKEKDQVKVTYYENEYGQLIITDIILL